jgi:hypothetical protein
MSGIVPQAALYEFSTIQSAWLPWHGKHPGATRWSEGLGLADQRVHGREQLLQVERLWEEPLDQGAGDIVREKTCQDDTSSQDVQSDSSFAAVISLATLSSSCCRSYGFARNP